MAFKWCPKCGESVPKSAKITSEERKSFGWFRVLPLRKCRLCGCVWEPDAHRVLLALGAVFGLAAFVLGVYKFLGMMYTLVYISGWFIYLCRLVGSIAIGVLLGVHLCVVLWGCCGVFMWLCLARLIRKKDVEDDIESAAGYTSITQQRSKKHNQKSFKVKTYLEIRNRGTLIKRMKAAERDEHGDYVFRLDDGRTVTIPPDQTVTKGNLEFRIAAVTAPRKKAKTGRNAAQSPPDTPRKQTARRSDAAKISFTCASCGKKMKTAADKAGKKTRCPACGKRVVIPAGRNKAQCPPPHIDSRNLNVEKTDDKKNRGMKFANEIARKSDHEVLSVNQHISVISLWILAGMIILHSYICLRFGSYLGEYSQIWPGVNFVTIAFGMFAMFILYRGKLWLLTSILGILCGALWLYSLESETWLLCLWMLYTLNIAIILMLKCMDGNRLLGIAYACSVFFWIIDSKLHFMYPSMAFMALNLVRNILLGLFLIDAARKRWIATAETTIRRTWDRKYGIVSIYLGVFVFILIGVSTVVYGFSEATGSKSYCDVDFGIFFVYVISIILGIIFGIIGRGPNRQGRGMAKIGLWINIGLSFLFLLSLAKTLGMFEGYTV